MWNKVEQFSNDAGYNLVLRAHFLLRWRATSDFLNPSRLKRRLAKRLAAATSAWRLPLVRVSLLLRPSLSLRSWSTSGSEASRAFSLLKQVSQSLRKYFRNLLPLNNKSHSFVPSVNQSGKFTLDSQHSPDYPNKLCYIILKRKNSRS